MFRIYPYMGGSQSVRTLKEALGGKIIKLENSSYVYRPNHTVINWGNSRPASWMVDGMNIINRPEAVALASNKLLTFNALAQHNVATVPFTTDAEQATLWLRSGQKVFVRHSLTGHSGEGIEIVQDNTGSLLEAVSSAQEILDEAGLDYLSDIIDSEFVHAQTEEVLPEAPLYTKGVTNDGEYRVHVFNGEVILYQKKSRRVDENGEVEVASGEDADVRNLASNWVYRTGNLRRLERVEQLAVSAISALGLNFGAVDIIKDTNGDVFVLEVNSAPGLGNSSTLEAYRRAFLGQPAVLDDEPEDEPEGDWDEEDWDEENNVW